MPEVTKKRAAIAEIIRKLTEEQRLGEVVSWPKISFLPSQSDFLRGSQLWEQWEEEDSKAELPVKTRRARRTVDIESLKTKSKPSVVPRLKKEQTSEWDFPDFDDYISVPQESRGRGGRGRLGGRRGGLGGRGKLGRGGGTRGRGGKGVIDDSTDANSAQEGPKARRGGNRGGGVSGRGRGEERNNIEEAEDWKFKSSRERNSELMNDVLLRVTSREANQGKEKTGKLSSKGLKGSQKELEFVKQIGPAALSDQASR